MQSVRPLRVGSVPGTGVLCLALAHNEMRRVPDFLAHHRALGVAHFLVLDDASTDGTREYLEAQPDVSLFQPHGTTYREHKARWRKELLDRHTHDRWVLLADLDEHFVYPHCDARQVGTLADHLDEEGAQALFAPMVEMYADAPLDREPPRGVPLAAAYPHFDAHGYRLVRPSRRHLRQFPTPPLDLLGGPRERLFYGFDAASLDRLSRLVLRRFTHLHRSMTPGRLDAVGNTVARAVLRRTTPRPPLVMSKLPLLKWRAGLALSGGAHAISGRLPLSKLWGGLLHYKFLRLPGEAADHVARGQHAQQAAHYRVLLAAGGFDRTPFHAGSRTYRSWQDLLACGLLRSSPDWDRR